MKLLRNPIVVGVLAVVAVLFVLNALRPILPHMGGSPAGPAAVPAPPAAAGATAPSADPVISAETDLADAAGSTGQADWSELSNQYAHWAEAPKRDPFHIHNVSTNETADAATVLTLNAVWQTSASTLAVINNQVVGKDDKVLGFQIESIETDGVWVLGPNGREELHFKQAPAVAEVTGTASPGLRVFETGLRVAQPDQRTNLKLDSAFRLGNLEMAKAKAKAEGKLLGFIMVWDQFFEPSEPTGRGSSEALAHFYLTFDKSLVLVFVRHEDELNRVPDAVRQGFFGPDEGGFAPNMAVVTADCSQYVCEIPYGGNESNGKVREQIFRDKIAVIKKFLGDHDPAGTSRQNTAP